MRWTIQWSMLYSPKGIHKLRVAGDILIIQGRWWWAVFQWTREGPKRKGIQTWGKYRQLREVSRPRGSEMFLKRTIDIIWPVKPIQQALNLLIASLFSVSHSPVLNFFRFRVALVNWWWGRGGRSATVGYQASFFFVYPSPS